MGIPQASLPYAVIASKIDPFAVSLEHNKHDEDVRDSACIQEEGTESFLKWATKHINVCGT